ncbi:hypothetical protein CQW23_02828 [Capsicum baccatum]|uniref:Uncharacterized protein n=1 Tax=Capsicum baccatum TaxID=33114 RepID=A0A2G2XSJ6_CAPBA|nr:hypothetical protein CQW23_02828 [Capsicum baccatum]
MDELNIVRPSPLRLNGPGPVKSTLSGRSTPRGGSPSFRRLNSGRTPRRDGKSDAFSSQWFRSNRIVLWLLLITLWAYGGFYVQSRWAHGDNKEEIFGGSEDMTKMEEKNGCFSIERRELTYPKSKLVDEADAKTLMTNLRAVLEGLIINHFGSEIAKEACARTILKSEEISTWMKANYEKSCKLFIALKRK